MLQSAVCTPKRVFIAEHNLFTSQLHIGILSEMKEIVKCIYFPLRAFYTILCKLRHKSGKKRVFETDFGENSYQMSPNCHLSAVHYAILPGHSLHFQTKSGEKRRRQIKFQQNLRKFHIIHQGIFMRRTLF